MREEGYAYRDRSRVPAVHGELAANEGQGTKETTNVFALHAEIVYWPQLRQQGCFHRFPQPCLALPHFVIVTEVHRRRLNRYSAFKLVPLSS